MLARYGSTRTRGSTTDTSTSYGISFGTEEHFLEAWISYEVLLILSIWSHGDAVSSPLP